MYQMYHTFAIQCKIYFQHSVLSNIFYFFYFSFGAQLSKKKERGEQNIYKAKITKQKKKKKILFERLLPCHELNLLHHLFTPSSLMLSAFRRSRISILFKTKLHRRVLITNYKKNETCRVFISIPPASSLSFTQF